MRDCVALLVSYYVGRCHCVSTIRKLTRGSAVLALALLGGRPHPAQAVDPRAVVVFVLLPRQLVRQPEHPAPSHRQRAALRRRPQLLLAQAAARAAPGREAGLRREALGGAVGERQGAPILVRRVLCATSGTLFSFPFLDNQKGEGALRTGIEVCQDEESNRPTHPAGTEKPT